MTLEAATAWLLALAVVGAWARLAVWQARAEPAARSSRLRLAALLALQPVLAGLLFLTLFPPPREGDAGTLVVATRAASLAGSLAAGERLAVLPEAPAALGGEPTPDLGTALRRHPGVHRLRIIGDGLEARDRDAAAGLAIVYAPPPPPRGLVELALPKRASPGASFQLGGRTNGVNGGSIELLDPAGAVIDVQPLSGDGRFRLSGAARAAGPAVFGLRLRNRGRATVEIADAPVWIAADPPPRVLLLAGAPGPEVKQLRRWITDAGMPLATSVGVGGGLELGDAPPPLTADALQAFDLVVADERSWAALSESGRTALLQAVRGGLGLLLRITGQTPDPVRAQWSAIGLPISSGEATAAVRLRARPPLPPGRSDATAGEAQVQPPDLTRRLIDVPGADAPALAEDADGAALGRWRAEGRGRAAVWAVTDSSGLVTAGHGDRYGELWSAVFTTLARPSRPRGPDTPDMAREGRRSSLCGLADGAEVVGPGETTRLRPDPASGAARCGGYWPRGSGWRLLRSGGQDTPIFVQPAGALPNMERQEVRDATLGLQRAALSAKTQGQRGESSSPGPAWPTLLLLLAATAAGWRLERVGRRSAARATDATRHAVGNR